MSCETTIHGVARITMQSRKLTATSRPRYDWVAHTIQFKDEQGKVIHSVTAHGLDGEAPLQVTVTADE